MNNLCGLLDDAKNAAPERIALVGFDTHLSYEALHRHSTALSNALIKHAGDGVVAVMLPNVLAFPVALFGIWYSGRIATLVNPLFTADEILKQCQDSGAETIIIGKIFYPQLKKVIHRTKINFVILVEIGDLQKPLKRNLINLLTWRFAIFQKNGVKHAGFNTILRRHSKMQNTAKPNPIALLQYTGGTSGVLKAAVLSHQNILANVAQLENWLPAEMDARSTVLTPLPLYHIFALTINCLLFVRLKAQNILVADPRNIRQLVALFKKYTIHAMTGVNTLFAVLVRDKNFRRLDFSALRITVAGGMPLQKKVFDDWQKITGKPILQGYGLTECSPVVSVEDDDADTFTGSVGKPLADTKIRISDESGKPKQNFEVGEICIFGPQVMAGYWQQKSLNEKNFDDAGFFKSGDLGYLDDTGRLFIVDRVKDMIIVSGFNVYPIEVEKVLNAHPDVVESACIGISSKRNEQAVVAFVVKKPDAILEKKMLINYCKEHLAHYKIPKKIRWMTALPKSNIGKILKRELRV